MTRGCYCTSQHLVRLKQPYVLLNQTKHQTVLVSDFNLCHLYIMSVVPDLFWLVASFLRHIFLLQDNFDVGLYYHKYRENN